MSARNMAGAQGRIGSPRHVHEVVQEHEAVNTEILEAVDGVPVDRPRRWCDGDPEFAENRGAPPPRRRDGPARPAQRRGGVDVQEESVPSIGPGNGPPECGARHAAGVEGEARRRRLRPALHTREGGELAGEPRLVVVPKTAHGLDIVVGPPPASAEGHTDGLVLTRHIAHTDTDEEPALGQHVDRGELLRQNHRIAQREDHDARPELHPRRPRRGVGQHGHRVEHLALRRERGRRSLGVDQYGVLAHPD